MDEGYDQDLVGKDGVKSLVRLFRAFYSGFRCSVAAMLLGLRSYLFGDVEVEEQHNNQVRRKSVMMRNGCLVIQANESRELVGVIRRQETCVCITTVLEMG